MIEKEATYLLRYLGIKFCTKYPTSPISLSKIFPLFPIKFRHTPMDSDIDGMFIRSKKGNYIYINSNRPFTRRRFSAGHEFGHYYLGHDSDISMVTNRHRPVEVQANRFSAAFLAPADLVYKLHKEKDSIAEMAEWLRISEISTAIRCLDLGIRIYEAELIRSEYFAQQGDPDYYLNSFDY